MDGAVTREEAAARWRLDLENADADSRQTWPEDITAGMSEFERLTLITEILLPVRNELALEFEEARQPDRQPSGDSHGDDDSNTGQEDETGVNRVYPVILAAAAACNRWLKEDLGPGLRAGGQDFETPMTLDPATDIDHWARERAKPLTEEPAGGDIERWLRWADLRTARTLPEETAPWEEWSEGRGPQHGPGPGGRSPADPGQAPHEGWRPGHAASQRRGPGHRERLPGCRVACQHPTSLGHCPGPGPQRRCRTGRRPLKALPAPTEKQRHGCLLSITLFLADGAGIRQSNCIS